MPQLFRFKTINFASNRQLLYELIYIDETVQSIVICDLSSIAPFQIYCRSSVLNSHFHMHYADTQKFRTSVRVAETGKHKIDSVYINV